MNPFSKGPATAKSARARKLTPGGFAQATYAFDLPTIRRLAFVRWLVATGRLGEGDRAAPPRTAAPAATRLA